MAKAIMLSIRPKYVSMILNKTKTIEVRKRFPKDYKGWVYIYCTKSFIQRRGSRGYRKDLMINHHVANGKVVARFYCDKVEDFEREYLSRYVDDYYGSNGEPLNKKFYRKTCLTEEELFDYIGNGSGYAIHISNLEIFDKPKDLKHFRKYCEKTFNEYSCIDCKAYKVDWDLGNWCKKSELILTKAPQSFMFIEVEE